MDIRSLKYFLEVCKHGSLSKAAKNLYISQQGLSKAISTLEKEINAPLFYRNSNGSDLTKYGEYLKDKSVSIVYQFDILTEGIKEMAHTDKHIIKIGVSYGVLNSLSMDLFDNFKEFNPNIDLIIEEYTDFECEEAVLNNHVDIGFAISHLDKNKFDYELIKSERLYALVSKAHPLCTKDYLDFSDLKNENIIISSKSSKVYHNFLIKCLESNFDPNIIKESKEMILIHDLSKHNEGIGISIHYAHTPNCKINYIPFKDNSFTWDICIITKKNIQLNDNLTLFMNYIFSSLNLSIN
ncbi:LysR family transcriptional regulator [Paraclostridium bifermentans]|uniref:LysR family transcriptional regulator n=1 Tax=Paraclostridium bifermentans TaxID=1490 RepID=UPI0011DCB3D1|nr:LysR family transcriptional regulator [Paraclostridium bifermentans]MBS5954478.1 LysR family transcriptional regulator [Paraclostridium bifermentans]MBU5288785.1 LysR family transcriptional regulator [Paraclostridium bifermentans]MDU3337689.1 LysR family transcriptional regulator [Paraclostridium bifermentans]